MGSEFGPNLTPPSRDREVPPSSLPAFFGQIGETVRALTFTFYRHCFEKIGKARELDWEKWVEIFSFHEVRGTFEDSDNLSVLDKQKNGPAIVLAEFREGVSRRASEVVAVNALALDIEKTPETEVAAALNKIAEYEWIAYSTHKHGSIVGGPEPRLRVILPLAEPLDPASFKGAWLGLYALTNRVNDEQTKDINRLHFLPSTFDARLPIVHRNRGRWISLEDLGSAAEDKIEKVLSATKRGDRLDKLSTSLQKIRKEHPYKKAVSALLSGAPVSEPGKRHEAILGVTMQIAHRDRGLTDDELLGLFSRSLEAMSSQPEPPTEDEVVAAYRGACEKTEEEEKHKIADKQSRGEPPIGDKTLDGIASKNGWTVDDLENRWVIQYEGTGYILNDHGEYVGPFSRDDYVVAVRQLLARAPVRLVDLNKNGVTYRPIVDIVQECGTLARGVVADLSAQRTRFDPVSNLIIEAVRPIRGDLRPRFDPEIDFWLKMLGGPLYPKLVDWMSVCPDLNKLLCAVYFDGSPGSGKTLIAHGLASLWSEGGPSEIGCILSDFNEEITQCPLIIADEEIPRSYHQTVTAVLRSMLSTTSRKLKRKWRPPADLRGAIRIILAANNEFLLESKDVSSAQDLNAIAQRFLYVPVSDEATGFIKQITREKLTGWKDRGIAEHALYLAKNHTIEKPGGRFWVEGDVSQMHRILMTGTKWNSRVCEWLVRYLMNPAPFDSKDSGLVRCEGGELLVNDQALLDSWDMYIRTRDDADTAKIGAGLRAISKSNDRKQIRWKGRRYRYREIDIGHLISWADRYGIGDPQVITDRVAGVVPMGGYARDANEETVGPDDYTNQSRRKF